MKYFFISLISIIFSIHSVTYSQIIDNVENDVGSFFTTGGNLATSFFSFDQPTQLKFAGSLLAIGAGYSVDYNIKKFAARNHSPFNDNLFSIDKIYGSGYTLIGIGGLYGYGILFHNDEVRKIGLQTIEAVGYAGIITTVLKTIVGRSRPYTNEGKFRFRPINFSAAHTSFPSGHSTVAFAVSTVLANNTNSLFLKILCYSASTLVVGARLYHNAHWFSDTIAGSAIGYFVGDFVSKPETENKQNDKGLSFNVGFNSINLSYKF